MTFKRTLKYYYLRIKNLKGDPRSIALGMAIGVFVGLTPTIPFHTVAILLAATLLNASRLAGIIGASIVSNPFTIPIHYYLAYRIGQWVTAADVRLPDTYSIVAMLRMGWRLAVAMLAGGLILGIIPALLAYFLTLYAFKRLGTLRRHKAASMAP